jgi:hypothetical protein
MRLNWDAIEQSYVLLRCAISQKSLSRVSSQILASQEANPQTPESHASAMSPIHTSCSVEFNILPIVFPFHVHDAPPCPCRSSRNTFLSPASASLATTATRLTRTSLRRQHPIFNRPELSSASISGAIFDLSQSFLRPRCNIVKSSFALLFLLRLLLPSLSDFVFMFVFHAMEGCVVRAAVAFIAGRALSRSAWFGSNGSPRRHTLRGCSIKRKQGHFGVMMDCL